MATPILFLKDIELNFGGKALFSKLSLQIFKGDKICLIGRNGCGKSSLLKIIAGIFDFDKGEKFVEPKVKIGYLSQDNIFNPQETIYDYVLANIDLTESTKEEHLYKADIILGNLDLDGSNFVNMLSGGKLRRASLAKALVEEPEILLLDEPTNHLDIASIEWLESYIKNYKGALICISHDREFLKNISDKIFWLDRGILRTANKGFSYFEDWSNEVYEIEHKELQKLSKKLAEENLWLQQGVTARRKRNQGRLKNLYAIREKLSSDTNSFNKSINSVKLTSLNDSAAPKLIFEMNNVSFEYENSAASKKIINNFSIRVTRGEKIGLIGKNGTGKTTFIRLLMNEIKPTSGTIKLGANVSISYFDQKREALDPLNTLLNTLCPEGGDSILVNGQYKHVASYLKDFLFDPKQFKSPVSSLSGGEANRLLLAKILANPGNFLILDEPTNDLDMDTLDLLEDMLAEYQGTLIIVSHDRDFLDRIVTRSLIFEEIGKISDFIGGYTDYTKQISSMDNKAKTSFIKEKNNSKEPKTYNKLSYKYARELEQLPEKITCLENEIKKLEDILSNPELYSKAPEEFSEKSKLLEAKKFELSQAENRWLELEELNEGFKI
ncbi:MAG: ABC-F family ATP-binding cassette domain-containing protein [Alphaproteobacteria bacterium]